MELRARGVVVEARIVGITNGRAGRKEWEEFLEGVAGAGAVRNGEVSRTKSSATLQLSPPKTVDGMEV